MIPIYKSLKIRERAWFRVLRDNSGVALIEFVIVFPIFILFFIGLLEVGLVTFGNAVINDQISQVARISAAGCRFQELNNTGMCVNPGYINYGMLKDNIRYQSAGLVNPERVCFTARVVPQGAPVGNLFSPAGSINLGQGDEIVIFYASYNWPVFFGFMHKFLGSAAHFRMVSMVRNETFGNLGPGRVSPRPSACGG